MPHVAVGFSAIVVHDGHLLLGRRKGTKGGGLMALPGGKLEFGESLEHAVRRELAEETGLQAYMAYWDPFRPEVWVSMQPPGVFHPDEHWVTLWLLAKLVPGASAGPELLEPDKCDWWTWVTLNELHQMLPADAILAWANRLPHPQLDWLPLDNFTHYKDGLGL